MKQLIIFLVVLALCAVGYVELTNYFEEKETQVEPIKTADWCFHKLMPYGGSMTFGENEAGNYQYQLLAAKDGVEVWVPCKQ